MHQQPPAQPPRRGWAVWTTRQRVAAGAGAFAAVSVLCYGAATLTGYKPDGPSALTPANAASSPASAPSLHASASGTARQTTAPPSPHTPIDQAGDPGTPCAMTYRADGRQTVVSFRFARAGEIITHLGDTAGNLYRHDEQVTAGLRSFVDDVPLSRVDDAGAILQEPDGTRHVCSIAPAGPN